MVSKLYFDSYFKPFLIKMLAKSIGLCYTLDRLEKKGGENQ